ncbi:hypothetical protein ACFQ2M_22545 [Kitasatospora saccharophila]|uniref:hypothetical protein n=1 Tax=Kitasatospora saccharophila TaxID=407973 RepID=UPI00363CC71E
MEELVKMGRNTGFLIVLITQKPTGDAIPTAIRDVCSVALSFAQRSTEAAVATLGENIRQWKDMDPSTMQHSDYVGVAVMARDSHEGFLRVRTPYVSADDTARIARATAHLTADPADLLTSLAPAPSALATAPGQAPESGPDLRTKAARAVSTSSPGTPADLTGPGSTPLAPASPGSTQRAPRR